MRVTILGSAAGGGFPQWNCNCRNCAAVRSGHPKFRARTQSSLAVSRDGENWMLLNASPDLRQQINDTPALAAKSEFGLRHSPIKAVVVTNGDVDHIAGLINLREGQAFSLYGSDRVLGTIAANSLFNILAPAVVSRTILPLKTAMAVSGGGVDLGVTVEAFPVPGKVALYLEDEKAGPGLGTREGDTIGLEVRDPATGKSFFYIPGCAAVDEPLARRIAGAALVFFDGTVFTDDEMPSQGLPQKTGQRMGHMCMSGSSGSIAAFAPLNVNRRIYVHMNNSNPALEDGSDARQYVERAGWDVGHDGMEIRL